MTDVKATPVELKCFIRKTIFGDDSLGLACYEAADRKTGMVIRPLPLDQGAYESWQRFMGSLIEDMVSGVRPELSDPTGKDWFVIKGDRITAGEGSVFCYPDGEEVEMDSDTIFLDMNENLVLSETA